MKMSKFKKSVIAAVSVFLCLCITAAFVIFIKKDNKSSIAKGEGSTASTGEISQTTVPATSATVTESQTVSATATTVKPTEKPTEPYTQNTEIMYYPSFKIEGALPQKEAVSGSWFDDAVFIGDSVSVMLTMYESSVDRLGKAQFLTAGSLSATNALWDVSDHSVHPKFNGKKQKVEDSIAQMQGVNKVYIMLGMNDITSVGVNNGIKNFEELCNRILAKNPNVQIYVQSVTPLISGSKSCVPDEGKLNNMTIYQYNTKLADLAQKRGWYFVNVAEVMLDGKGYLNKDYCSDPEVMGLHFTTSGCKVWIDYLLTHTP